MKIALKNCNNIDEGELVIEKTKLNIKYGANGTGKSTIAKAIELKLTSGSSVAELLPFKLRQANPSSLSPEVLGLEGITSLKIFNEKYLEQFTFKPDELVANSFDIFIKTPDYEEHLQAIEAIVGKLKTAFSADPELENFLNDLRELAGSFKLTKTGISKASAGYKALEGGNKCEHIPAGLEAYEPFLKHSSNVSWIGWQQQGQPFLDLSTNCPFCTSPAADKRTTISRVSQEYDKKTIQHLTAIIGVITKLGKYFSDDARDRIEAITKLRDGLEPEHESFLKGIKQQIDDLSAKLEQLKGLSGQSFEEKEKVSEKLPQYRLDLKFFDRLDSPETRRITDSLNSKLDEIQKEALALQVAIGKHRTITKQLITRNRKDINNFLSKAGYKYEVLITDEKDGHRLRLKHLEHEDTLKGGNQHLSFGERNAFALVLFMFDCLATNPNLIILDDPISSFDKDKKFAILDALFLTDRSLKGKTVILLTHDIEPVIDTIKVLGSFKSFALAHFLKTTNGQLVERPIASENMLSFAQICNKTLSSSRPQLIKLIYLRRHHEVIDDLGDEYQLLSNLFHKRPIPQDSRLPKIDADNWPDMDSAPVLAAAQKIGEAIGDPSFSYTDAIAQFTDEANLRSLYNSALNGYEKLQIYRLIDEKHKDSVIRKYINGAYHIENDFICQLDPTEFDPIPQYVVDECDKVVAEASA